MQQKRVNRLIYKIESGRLKDSKWNLTLPLKEAMRVCPEVIVSLNDSQCQRFLDEMNGIEDLNERVRSIQRKIRNIKKLPMSRESKMLIASYYDSLYELQFQWDYICVVMNSKDDYRRANQGFSVDYGEVGGERTVIKYTRLLGTNGGIKNSTIVYVNEEKYDELKKRLDNGRDKQKELVPAKLEAYQALICSGSIPLPEPNGIIVVKDCVTTFKENVIQIDDSVEGEPLLTYENDYEIEHNDSDGFGLMLPSYSKRVNKYLTGNGSTISGMNTRYAWTKGMLYTVDYIEFAENVAGTYEVTDVWGDKRDVRNAEVILTASMLKLWDGYKNWEDYYANCAANHYQFSATKITPDKLENVRYTNYQFLQSYDFSDEDLEELCKPAIDELKDVIGLDYRKSLAFLAGMSLNEDNAYNDSFECYVRALMIDRRVIHDPFIRKKIYHLIKKRIEMGCKGAFRINGNYATISGDPYSLMQSMFAMPVTGLLKKGEVYHKYWLDKGAKEIACFRAPMTCHNNIRKMTVADNDETRHWYQYITTALVYNSWDSACEAENGADKDGDTNMCTDNPIIVSKTKNSPTIICLQKKAEKRVVTENDIIAANILAFNDDIGTITNYVTSMFEVQSGLPKDSDEYETLNYRIMCGQHFQQSTIDRAKGIIAKPMPPNWYTLRDNKVRDGDSKDEIFLKEYNTKIAAARKPYFMTYVYPKLRTENNKYIKNNTQSVIRRFGQYGIRSLEDLEAYKEKTPEMRDYLKFYHMRMPVGINPCVVNRISWIFENEFKNYLTKHSGHMRTVSLSDFDYSMFKSGETYSKATFDKVYEIYREYCRRTKNYQQESLTKKTDKYEIMLKHKLFTDLFKSECEQACPNEKMLCDIVLDVCYTNEKSKQFAWDICGKTILENLLEHNKGKIHFPKVVSEDGEFEYNGRQFTMVEKEMEGCDDNSQREGVC